MLLPLFSRGQYIGTGANILDTTTERYVQNSPTNAAGNRRDIEKIRDSAYWSIRTLRAFIRAVDSTHASVNPPKNMIWVSPYGELYRGDLNSLILDTANIYVSKAWLQSRGYLTSVHGSLGYTPVPDTRTITINGNTQDLTIPRTWNVGDILSSGSYSNPTWITSLAYSKLTGTPTIPTNTTQISEGTNLYYTDMRARGAFSAGSGISISSGVITNTAADQTVTLTAGRGITITGTYPNFTISLVTPTISIVTRPIGTSPATFTISATKEAIATYTITCSVTNPLLVGTSTATAFLEYSVNGGSSWLLPAQVGNSSGVGVTVTLQLTNGQTGTLVGMIPANALVRIRTGTAGTASLTYVTGQETVY